VTVSVVVKRLALARLSLLRLVHRRGDEVTTLIARAGDRSLGAFARGPRQLDERRVVVETLNEPTNRPNE